MTDYTELIDDLRNGGLHGFSIVLKAADVIERLQKERDAAVADLTAALYRSCRFCKYNSHGFCKGDPSLEKLQSSECWEWRGVQE